MAAVMEGEMRSAMQNSIRIQSTLGGDVVFPVTIEFDEQPKGLLWGMSADVQIQTAE
jgi:hypothetical protein